MSDTPPPIRRLGSIPLQPATPGMYRCRECKNVYPIDKTSDQLMFEARLIGITDPADCVAVCEPCYAKLMKDEGKQN